MKPSIILTTIFLILNYGECEYRGPSAPPPRGLGFKGSVSQAKRQLLSFYAHDIPVKESISKMEDYYNDLEEENLRGRPHVNRLMRKPCKVLPDPQPGLVNHKLVDPIFKYHPINKQEKFFGEFAPPIKYEYINRPPNPQQLPVYRPYPNYPSNQYPRPRPRYPRHPQGGYPRADPFNGYRAKYQAKNEYFETETFSPPRVTETDLSEITPTKTAPYSVSTLTINTSSWQSQLSVDYSLRMASLSSAIVANSAILSSMSVSAKLVSKSLVWASKEASLRSKLASYSATATKTRHNWHW